MTLPWYKRYPKDALEGMKALSLEQRGAYNTILDLIYYRMPNPLPDDDAWLAGQMGLRMPRWRRLKAELIDLGKIACEGGCIVNSRASREIGKASRRHPKDGKTASVSQSDAAELRAYCSNNTGITPENYGHNGPLVSNENNDITSPTRADAGAGLSEASDSFLLSSSTQPYFEKPLIRERARAAEEPAAPLPAEGFQKKMGKGKATLPETVPDEWMIAAQRERGVMKLDPLPDIKTVAVKFLYHMRAEGRAYRDWRARWMKWALDERLTSAEERALRTAEMLEKLKLEEAERDAERNRRANEEAKRRHKADALWEAGAPARAEAEAKRRAAAEAEAAKRRAEQQKRDEQAAKERREAEEARERALAPQLRIQRLQGEVFARYGLDKGLDLLARLDAGDPDTELIAQQIEADLGITPPRKASEGP